MCDVISKPYTLHRPCVWVMICVIDRYKCNVHACKYNERHRIKRYFLKITSLISHLITFMSSTRKNWS